MIHTFNDSTNLFSGKHFLSYALIVANDQYDETLKLIRNQKNFKSFEIVDYSEMFNLKTKLLSVSVYKIEVGWK